MSHLLTPSAFAFLNFRARSRLSAMAFTHELIAWRIGRLRIAWITISCFPASVNASVANDWTAFVRSPTDCAAVSTPPTIESFRFGLSCSAIMSVTEPLR